MDNDSRNSISPIPIKQQVVRMTTGLDKVGVSSSVFARLGGKSEPGPKKPETPQKSSGILKSSPTKKAISIRRVPAKAATMIADEYEERRVRTSFYDLDDTEEMDQDRRKSVKFSPEDEILEIAPRRLVVKPKQSANVKNNVRMRLGGGINGRASVLSSLHATKKTIRLKNSSAPKTPINKVNLLKFRKLRSEDILSQATPIQSRLDLKQKTEHLAHRIGKFSIADAPDSRKQKGNANNAIKKSSVFNRLGFN